MTVRSGDVIDSAIDTSFSTSDRSFGSNSSQQNRSYQSFEPAGEQPSSRSANYRFQSNNRSIHRNDQAIQGRKHQPYKRSDFSMPSHTEFTLNVKLMLPKDGDVDFEAYLAKNCGHFPISVTVNTNNKLEDIRSCISNTVATVAGCTNSENVNLGNYSPWNLQFLQKKSIYLAKWKDITVKDMFDLVKKKKILYVGLQLLNLENVSASNDSDSDSIDQENVEPGTPPARFKKLLDNIQAQHIREMKRLNVLLDAMEKKMNAMGKEMNAMGKEVSGNMQEVVRLDRKISVMERKSKMQDKKLDILNVQADALNVQADALNVQAAALKERDSALSHKLHKTERYLVRKFDYDVEESGDDESDEDDESGDDDEDDESGDDDEDDESNAHESGGENNGDESGDNNAASNA
jgi:hypothetical protein